MVRWIAVVLSFIIFPVCQGQTIKSLADSIRSKYKIPELAFAIVSADTVFESETSGVQRVNTNYFAKPADRFHIGSNTKAITSFIAALLVQQKQIEWKTKFFDLFPELRALGKKAYQNITLEDLLTFRGKLPSYTYTFDKPVKDEITGDQAHQRLLLAKYFLSQNPMKQDKGLTPSNADYILAGLMLEKASRKSYKELVTDFGKTQGIEFGFDYPNLSDTLQPWGHDENLHPLPPLDNYKLNWLLAAGNINISLPDYIKFIQLQLRGLKGMTSLLPKETFNKLLFGLPVFSFGWFNQKDAKTQHQIAKNEGNAGAFISEVQIIKEVDRAYIILTNLATDDTIKGITELLNSMKAKYGK